MRSNERFLILREKYVLKSNCRLVVTQLKVFTELAVTLCQFLSLISSVLVCDSLPVVTLGPIHTRNSFCQ